MTIRVVCVGKLKEQYARLGCEEYFKRLGRFVRVEVAEVADAKAPQRFSAAQLEKVKAEEGERILSRIGPGETVAALCVEGKRMTSGDLAQWIDKTMTDGASCLCFVIGGSNGLSQRVLARADMRLSFSDFTFCHQLARVVLAEQVYRAFTILNGLPYHK